MMSEDGHGIIELITVYEQREAINDGRGTRYEGARVNLRYRHGERVKRTSRIRCPLMGMTRREALNEIAAATRESRPAQLRGANLRQANLRGLNLRRANLMDADLWEADMRGANLRWADLRDSNLHRVDLRKADLRNANLKGAVLRRGDIRGAKIRWSSLEGADLDQIIGLRW